MKKIGFIGLGRMGFPMAENLLKMSGNLTVCRRPAAKSAALEEKGAVIACSNRELAEKCEIIGLSLPGPAEVGSVVPELIESAAEGTVLLDFSTVSPKLSREMADQAAAKGVVYIDIPVSGGPVGAAGGKLSLMIGASEAEFTNLGLKPYTDTIGDKYFFMDGRGNGSAIKIINNYMAFAAQAINGEALAMADALGISTEAFYEVTTKSSGNNMILNAKMAKIKTGNYEPGFALDLVVKDLELGRQLCQDEQIPNFTLNTALQLYRVAQSQGCGKEDSSAVIRVIREMEKGNRA